VLDNSPSLQDQVRKLVLSNYANERETTLDELKNKLGLSHSQVMQTLYRLQRANEVNIIKEEGENGHNRVIGVRPIRMEKESAIEDRIQESAANKNAYKEKKINIGLNKIPNTIKYANAKLAIEEARKLLLEKGVDAKIEFDLDPIGEESIYLLGLLEQKIDDNEVLKQQLSAAQRNNETLLREREVAEQKKVPVPVSSD
jgi:hypothetical protein